MTSAFFVLPYGMSPHVNISHINTPEQQCSERWTITAVIKMFTKCYNSRIHTVNYNCDKSLHIIQYHENKILFIMLLFTLNRVFIFTKAVYTVPAPILPIHSDVSIPTLTLILTLNLTLLNH